jgi:hypothetical protein
MTDSVGRSERRYWLAIPIILVATLVVFLTVGSLGERRSELSRLEVADVLAQPDPVATLGGTEVEIVGWYANLDEDCEPPADEPAATTWLERTCPLRLLLAEQPAEGAPQAGLEAIGLRLAAPTGEPFPPRSEPGGWSLMLEPLIVTGHFDDPAAFDCQPERQARCRATFVVTGVDGLVH